MVRERIRGITSLNCYISSEDTLNGVYTFADVISTADSANNKGYNRHYRSNDTPLIIDNGSWQCRAGWATQTEPELVFRNVMARIKAKKVCLDHNM